MMEGVRLVTGGGGGDDSSSGDVDMDRCIVCQEDTGETLTGTTNGRKWIRDAAAIRKDIVFKGIRLVEDRDFVYHVSNDCYKSYTLQKSLDKLKGAQDESELQEQDASRKTRSSSSSRTPPSQPIISHEQICIICNCAKHKGTYKKYRLSEDRSASKFLKAAVALQDAVYVRTCDLQDVNSVFSADLFYHDLCMKGYVRMYERKVSQEASAGSLQSLKLTAWNAILADIAAHLESGSGFELSKIRDAFNTELNKHEIKPVTSR